MYKLIYKSQFAAGYDADQVVGNLAQLLQLKPKVVRLVFLSQRPSVIKIVETSAEVEQWRAAFLEAGVHLDVVSINAADAANIADQIELDLELHKLDEDAEAENDAPRQLLVKKNVPPEDDEEDEYFPVSARKAPVVAIAEVRSPLLEVLQSKKRNANEAARVSGAQKPEAEAPKTAPSTLAPKQPDLPVDTSPAKTTGKAPEKAKKRQASSEKEKVAAAEPEAKSASASRAVPVSGDQKRIKTPGSVPAAAEVKTPVPAPKQPEPRGAEEPANSKTAAGKKAVAEKTAQKKAVEEKTTHEKVVKQKTISEKVVAEKTTHEKPAAEKTTHKKPVAEKTADKKIAEEKKSDRKRAEGVTHDAKGEASLIDEKPAEEVSSEDAPVAGFAENDIDVDFHKSSFVLGMLVILFAIVLTAATILWLKRPLWEPVTPSAPNEKIVNAMATDALFVLAHADVSRLQQLPDILQPGAGLSNLPEPDVDFWRKLEQAGIGIAQQLDHVWVSAYRFEDRTQPLWVLTGKFNPDELRGWLKQNYALDEDSPQQMMFSAVSENSCEKQPAMMAVIESDRIILGAPERVAAFRGRFEAGAPADKDLSDWKSISEKQMLSVAFLNPAQFADASSAMVFGKLSLDPTPVKGIYLGVAPRMLPPMLEFNAVLVGANREAIDKTEATIAPIIANAKNTIVKDWPETLSIYERMKLSKTEQQLRATVFFDEKLQSQLQLWVNSLFTHTFAQTDSAGVVADERIDERPRLFTELESSKLPDFGVNKHINTGFTAQTNAGPFGLGISSIDATAGGAVINLEVNAVNLPNLGKEAKNVQLHILDIVDHQDQTLLSASGCDASGVRQVADIDMVYDGAYLDQGESKPYVGIQGAKKILLPETVALSAIGAIKGELSFNLPLSVERIKVDLPLAGKVIDSHGLQVRFLSSGASRLQFQHSGNSDRLLQINALNKDGKLLATLNTTREKNRFTGNQTTTIDVQGSIAAVEVIVASKMEKQVYPFSFGRIQPAEQPFAQEKAAPEFLTAAGLEVLKTSSPPTDVQYPYQAPQQTIVAGPAVIAVNQMSIQAQQLSLMADIYLGNQHPLTRQLSAARFFITEVEDSSGNIRPVNFQAPVALEHAGGSWADGRFQPDPAKPWLRGQLDLRGQDLGVSDVVAFWGKLVFLAASDPIAIQLPFQFGMQWNGADSSFKLASWEAGRLLFDIHGSFPELMAITALDDAGQPISQAAELRSNLGVNQVELPIKQRPATIEFSIARKQEMEEFSFEIRAQQ